MARRSDSIPTMFASQAWDFHVSIQHFDSKAYTINVGQGNKVWVFTQKGILF
jgi:hypothetical protein